MFIEIIYIYIYIYIYVEDLVLKNLQWLICHKNQPTKSEFKGKCFIATGKSNKWIKIWAGSFTKTACSTEQSIFRAASDTEL